MLRFYVGGAFWTRLLGSPTGGAVEPLGETEGAPSVTASGGATSPEGGGKTGAQCAPAGVHKGLTLSQLTSAALVCGESANSVPAGVKVTIYGLRD